MSLADWLGSIGLIVSVLGFAGTIWQLQRTVNASKATAAAITRTEKRMAMNHLLVLLPQIRMIEADLDTAVDQGDRRLTIRALVMFTHLASEVAGVLKYQSDADAELVTLLEEASRKSSEAKVDLIGNANKLPKSATRQVRSDLAELTRHLTGLASRITIEAGRPS